MKTFTIYDTATGEPKRWGEAEDITAQAGQNEIAIEGNWPAETHVLRSGRPTARNTGSRAEMVLTRLWRKVRVERNHLLMRHVDCISPVRWELMSAAEQDALRSYRQALLDVPQTQTDPHHIKWPLPPGQKEDSNA